MGQKRKMLNSFWMYFTLVFICKPVFASTSNETMSTILASIFDGYDKKLPPRYDKVGKDRQVKVVINVFVNSMYSISEADMDYSMSIFLRGRWMDERLKFEDTLNLTRLELDKSIFDDVWAPDIYILNEKSSDFHEVTVPNKLIHVYPDGAVQYSARFTILVLSVSQMVLAIGTFRVIPSREDPIVFVAIHFRVTGSFSCLMHLQKYPFDTQNCHFEVESYGHSTETMKFVWSDSAVTLADNIEFPQFSVKEIAPYMCEKDYYGIVYPCIGVKFVLERSYAYYLVQIYVPSVLIVILSWVNFWLDCTSVPARISLGLLTVLTMTTQSAGARANLPRVSYVKAIDIYMATCLAFVFLGLLEFAYVNVLTRVEGRKPNEKAHGSKKDATSSKGKHSNGQTEEIKDADTTEVNLSIRSETKRFFCFGQLSGVGRARLVDKISRVLFPAVFLVFNIIYWVFYLTWDPKFDEDEI